MDDQFAPVGAGDAQRAPGGRPPSWVILLSASLVAFGVFGRRSPASADTSADDALDDTKRAGETRPSSRASGRGWKDVLLSVYHGISDDRILLIAGGVTFYAMLALFPGIAAIVSVYGLFADPSRIAAHLDALSGFAPGGAVEVLREELTRLAHQDRAALGFGFAVSLGFSLWTANAGVSALFEALTAVCEEKESRGLIRYYALTLAFTVGTIVLVLLSLAILIALPLVIEHIPDPGVTGALLKIIRWPILLVLVGVAFAVIYRYGPGRSAPRWRWITWGSGFAVIAWLAASALFSWYVANFGHYDKTYGSLGAIIGFMTWIWVSIIVVLIGAKLDTELERRGAPVDAPGPPASRRAKTFGSAQT